MNFGKWFVTFLVLLTIVYTDVCSAYISDSLEEVSDSTRPDDETQNVSIESPPFTIQTPSGPAQVKYVANVMGIGLQQFSTVTSQTSFGSVQFANIGAAPEVADAVRTEIQKAGIKVNEPVPHVPGPSNKRFKIVGSKVFLTVVRLVPAGVWTLGMLQNAAHQAHQTFSMFPVESIFTSPNFASALTVGLSVSGMSALLFLTYSSTVAKFTDYRGFSGLLASKFFREFVVRHEKVRKALRLPEDLQPVESTRLAKFGKYWITESSFYSAILYVVALNGFALPIDNNLLEVMKSGAQFMGMGLNSMDPMSLLAFHVGFTSALSTWFQGSWDLGIVRQVNAMVSKYAGDPASQDYHIRVARIKWTLTSFAQVVTLALANFGVLSPSVSQDIYLVLGAVGVGYFLKQVAKYKDTPLEVPNVGDLSAPSERPARCEGVFDKTG